MASPAYNPTAPRLRPFPGARAWDTSNPWLFLGTIAGAKRARARRGSLVCPLDADPMSFSWPAAGLSIMVVGDDQKIQESMRLTRALLRDGARLVACVLAPSGRSYLRYSNDKGETT
jgi:hypothetical protein